MFIHVINIVPLYVLRHLFRWQSWSLTTAGIPATNTHTTLHRPHPFPHCCANCTMHTAWSAVKSGISQCDRQRYLVLCEVVVDSACACRAIVPAEKVRPDARELPERAETGVGVLSQHQGGNRFAHLLPATEVKPKPPVRREVWSANDGCQLLDHQIRRRSSKDIHVDWAYQRNATRGVSRKCAVRPKPMASQRKPK